MLHFPFLLKKIIAFQEYVTITHPKSGLHQLDGAKEVAQQVPSQGLPDGNALHIHRL